MNQYTVTMTGTFFVTAKSSLDAEGIVSEALLHIDQVDKRILDSETHWFESVIINGHHSTIVHDGDEMSDYDKQIFQIKYSKVTQ
jgi:hypothetical protein